MFIALSHHYCKPGQIERARERVESETYSVHSTHAKSPA
jgi:hypothetical protein